MSSDHTQKALLIDIGTGTRDILLYSAGNSLENNSKIVAPTATRKMAAKIKASNKDLKISGYTMGGGPLAAAMQRHIQRGFKIEIEPAAAFTIRNNLEQIRQAGFTIEEKITQPDLFFDEIELPELLKIFSELGERVDDLGLIGLSVQDHGDHEQNESARRKRFKCFLKALESSPEISSLIYTCESLPEDFSRMASGVKCIRRHFPEIEILIMDTCISAVAGCWFDKNIMHTHGPMLLVNFGNGHTLATVIENGRIHSIYEHHTGMLQKAPEMLDDHLKRLVEGKLDFEEVFASGGHGCKTFSPLPFNQLARVVATGPVRDLSERLATDFYLAAPGGDMMMTGPLGLLKGHQLLKGTS